MNTVAAETAHAIARSNDATVALAHVLDPAADEGLRDEKAASFRELTDEFEGVSVEQSSLGGDDVVGTTVEASKNYDVTIVGATRNSRLRRIVLDVIPEETGRWPQNRRYWHTGTAGSRAG